jgi:hypothetical protein
MNNSSGWVILSSNSPLGHQIKGMIMATERKRTRERRSISTGRPRNYSELYKNDHSGVTVANTGPSLGSTGGAVAPRETVIDWSKEYAHIAEDFRRLLIVSAILFGLIIAAGFVI